MDLNKAEIELVIDDLDGGGDVFVLAVTAGLNHYRIGQRPGNGQYLIGANGTAIGSDPDRGGLLPRLELLPRDTGGLQIDQRFFHRLGEIDGLFGMEQGGATSDKYCDSDTDNCVFHVFAFLIGRGWYLVFGQNIGLTLAGDVGIEDQRAVVVHKGDNPRAVDIFLEGGREVLQAVNRDAVDLLDHLALEAAYIGVDLVGEDFGEDDDFFSLGVVDELVGMHKEVAQGKGQFHQPVFAPGLQVVAAEGYKRKPCINLIFRFIVIEPAPCDDGGVEGDFEIGDLFLAVAVEFEGDGLADLLAVDDLGELQQQAVDLDVTVVINIKIVDFGDDVVFLQDTLGSAGADDLGDDNALDGVGNLQVGFVGGVVQSLESGGAGGAETIVSAVFDIN